MRQAIVLLLATFILAACASVRYVPVETVHSDTLIQKMAKLDSIYVRDSIYVYVKGDTVTKYVEKWRYKYRTQYDTLYIAKRDTVTVTVTEIQEKPIKWYNQGFIWVGRLCCIAFILWIIFLYLKRKL